MVTPVCGKYRRRNVVTFNVEPEEAWRTVVLNRWRNVCPSCFDAEAERAGVRYQFVDVGADVVEQRARAGLPVRQEATLARVVCSPQLIRHLPPVRTTTLRNPARPITACCHSSRMILSVARSKGYGSYCDIGQEPYAHHQH